jgi:hypothetical protein
MANENAASFMKLMKHPLKSRLFLFTKLPSAFFSGVRIKDFDEAKCMVTVPYKWFSQNPFHSTYFACLAMAAEMSTGVLALMNVYGRKPSVSMLVTKLEAEYFKKAVGLTTFTCVDGMAIQEAIEKAINNSDAQTIIAESVGTNEKGEMVAKFLIGWSFKAK